MDSSTKKILIIGSLGVGAYLLYKQFGPGATSAPPTASTTSYPLTAQGYSVTVPPGLTGWIAQTPASWQPKLNAWLQTVPQDQVDTLWDIVQDFNSGTPLPASWQAWWNTVTAQLGLS